MHPAPVNARFHPVRRRFENVGPFRYASTESALARLRELANMLEDSNEWIMARQFDPSLQAGEFSIQALWRRLEP